MSDAEDDDIESIRQQKAAELQEQGESRDEPVHVESEAHLQELFDGYSPVLVDFYADWCGPCQMLEPVLEDLAADTAATVAKVDVDEHQALAAQYNVQGIPTMVLVADGQQVEQLVGVQQADQLTDLIEQYS